MHARTPACTRPDTMARLTSVPLLLLLLLHSTHGESGSGPEGQPEDLETDSQGYECFLKVLPLPPVSPAHELTCFFKNYEAHHSNLTFRACCGMSTKDSCIQLMKQKLKYRVKSTYLRLYYVCDICIQTRTREDQCENYELKHIVKPEAPTNVTVTYQEKAKEYIIKYVEQDGFLKTKLIHQIALCAEHGEWTILQDVKAQHVRLLEHDLKRGAKYEVKVRSKPNGDYYKGYWSAWSNTEHFETTWPEQNGLTLAAIIMPTVGVILIAMVIVFVLWENRIKPYVWPHIPDHKSTLEHLCKKQKKDLDASFNPDHFEDLHIHKVDGIQAKVRRECLLEPIDTQGMDLPAENSTGQDLEVQPGSRTNSSLRLPMKSPGMLQPAGILTATLGDSTQSTLYALEHSPKQGHGGSCPNVAQSNVSHTARIRTSNDVGTASGQIRSSHLNPNLEIPVRLNNTAMAGRQEEAYVTMAAFAPTSNPQ
ncbi:interleukin-7 receptor subunit alpha [Ambystoma mexicanum]|uniref:interleukin-7 receptor subunit alpha n=1 Tax=Ambystoma mexicanum TaxID=8296 RepID=UPI0037E9142A